MPARRHNAMHCNKLQLASFIRTATHCNPLQNTHCNTLQHSATWLVRTQDQRGWNIKRLHIILQHIKPHCNVTHSYVLQQTVTHCNIIHSYALQHTTTHCNITHSYNVLRVCCPHNICVRVCVCVRDRTRVCMLACVWCPHSPALLRALSPAFSHTGERCHSSTRRDPEYPSTCILASRKPSSSVASLISNDSSYK